MRSSAEGGDLDHHGSEIASFGDFDRAALASQWTALTGSAAPKRSTAKLLALALAYEMQLRSSKQAQEDERAIAKALARSPCAPQQGKILRRLTPGARLLREWRGRTLAVDIVEGGYVFEGERYASLSAIARKATGIARNGPAFFGLRERRGV